MKRILIVDDEPHILVGLQHLLRDPQREIVVAGSAKAALERFQRESFHLLITDVMMPEMSGLDLIAVLRAREATKTLPIIILTAKGQAHDEAMAREVWNATLVAKPFRPSQLRELVSSTLNRPATPTPPATSAPTAG